MFVFIKQRLYDVKNNQSQIWQFISVNLNNAKIENEIKSSFFIHKYIDVNLKLLMIIKS
jgi:hypothetical protein